MDVWAEKRFNLPRSSTISGLINLDLTPYLRKILKDLSPQSPVTKVVLVCGTQVAKSTVILMAFAYRVDCRIYGDMLYYFPNDGMGKTWSKTKLDDTIKANDYMSRAIEVGKKKDDNVMFKKTLIGSLIISGGKSGSKYRSNTGKFIVADDFAEFPLNVGGTKEKVGEGSAGKLIEDRGSGTSGDAKIFINSSPKSEDECPAWREYKLTNQHQYYVRCPKCGLSQAWEFDNVIMPHDEYELTEEPWIECQNNDCDYKIFERDKFDIMKNGEWKPTNDRGGGTVNGYRLPSVYSLLGYPLTKMCQDWLDACKLYDETGDESEKIRHRNSKQAKPWRKRAGKTVKHSDLYKTRVTLDPIPEDCVILSAGIDVQGEDRIEISVHGHGHNMTYFLEHVKFVGDPRIPFCSPGSPFDQVQEFMIKKRYKNVHGIDQPIYCMGIDAGFLKDNVKDFLQRSELIYFQRKFAVFGKGQQSTATINFIPSTPTKDIDGFESWGLYVNRGKAALYNMLRGHLLGRSGLCFSDHYSLSENWFKQLTIERENEKGVFVKPHDHARNEPLDCFNYSRAAFMLAFKEFEEGIDWDDWKEWNKRDFSAQFKQKKASILGELY